MKFFLLLDVEVDGLNMFIGLRIGFASCGLCSSKKSKINEGS